MYVSVCVCEGGREGGKKGDREGGCVCVCEGGREEVRVCECVKEI